MKDKKPTRAELEKILDGAPCQITVNPDGSLSTRPYDEKDADSPLRVNVEGDELVIRIGVNRLDGHDNHPELPALIFEDRAQWVTDVIREIEHSDEVGGTPLIYMLDKCMNEALEQGSIGIAEDSPTHIGTCEKCGEYCMPLRYTKEGQRCSKCFNSLLTKEDQ